MEMVILGIIIIAMAFGLIIERMIRKARLYKYEDIEIGMTEDEVIDIMGFNYTQNLLGHGKIKYEWKINGVGFWQFGLFNWMPTKSVEVYVKNGKVYKVLANNM